MSVFTGCLPSLAFSGDVKEDRGYTKELYFCGQSALSPRGITRSLNATVNALDIFHFGKLEDTTTVEST